MPPTLSQHDHLPSFPKSGWKMTNIPINNRGGTHLLFLLLTLTYFFLFLPPFRALLDSEIWLLKWRAFFLIFALTLLYLVNIGWFLPRLLFPKKFLAYALALFFSFMLIVGIDISYSYFLGWDKLTMVYHAHFSIPPDPSGQPVRIPIPTMPFTKTIDPQSLAETGLLDTSAMANWRTNDQLQPVTKAVQFNMMAASIVLVLPMILICTIGAALESVIGYYQQIEKQKKTEHEKLISELSLLKSQLNPHFLFNTLNNIYSLSVSQSKDTEKAILKLSTLMRYMLYESESGKISLQKELEYLMDYIELQKMRISTRPHISIHVSIEGRPEAQQIEPILLIPFVENAFKHGISYVAPSQIDIRIMISPHALYFTVINSIHPNKEHTPYSGVGLNNARRRLELLYPGQYQLNIREEAHQFSVELTIVN